MTVRRSPVNLSKTQRKQDAQRLSLRWFVIAAATGCAYHLGDDAGESVGVFLACVVAGLLHEVLE
jgi:hypothetical protein